MRILSARIQSASSNDKSGTSQDHVKQLVMKKIQAQNEKKTEAIGQANARTQKNTLLNEKIERYENLNAKF